MASSPPVLKVGGTTYAPTPSGDVLEVAVGSTVALEITATFPANDGVMVYLGGAGSAAGLDCSTMTLDGSPLTVTTPLPIECRHLTSIGTGEKTVGISVAVTGTFAFSPVIILRYYPPGSTTMFETIATWEIGNPSAPVVGSGTDVPGTAGVSAFDGPVATALEAAASATGVFGVLVRGGDLVPVSAVLSSGVGPRGGVRIEADALSVSVATAGGATPQDGLLVASSGEIECNICAPLLPGTTVEAWVNSEPRLAAAVLVGDDHAEGDCVVLTIPVGAPLDGAGPIPPGSHTLQLLMDSADGPQVLATGLTVGTPVPSAVPAGEGGGPLGWWGVALALGLIGMRTGSRLIAIGG